MFDEITVLTTKLNSNYTITTRNQNGVWLSYVFDNKRVEIVGHPIITSSDSVPRINNYNPDLHGYQEVDVEKIHENNYETLKKRIESHKFQKKYVF